MYQSALSLQFSSMRLIRPCPSKRTVVESISVCSSIIDSYRHTICMQMIPHLALKWAVNGVLGAICHSAYLTRLSHSLTCLSCTVASTCLFLHREVPCVVALNAISGLITARSSLTKLFKRTPRRLNTHVTGAWKKQIRRYDQPATEWLMCNRYD